MWNGCRGSVNGRSGESPVTSDQWVSRPGTASRFIGRSLAIGPSGNGLPETTAVARFDSFHSFTTHRHAPKIVNETRNEMAIFVNETMNAMRNFFAAEDLR